MIFSKNKTARWIFHGLFILILSFFNIGAIIKNSERTGVIHGFSAYQSTDGSKTKISTNSPTNISGIQDFNLLSDQIGWILYNQKLFLTKDNGIIWNEITPANESYIQIYDVNFIDLDNGWFLWNDLTENGNHNLMISKTIDEGESWRNTTVALFKSTDPDALIASAKMFWLDKKSGWISVKRNSSSSFSIGTLFRTTDGGMSWSQLSLPIGDPVYFSTNEIGWTAGGAGGDEFFRSINGGVTWELQSISQPSGTNAQIIRYFLPSFENANNGILPIWARIGIEDRFEIYVTDNGGENWTYFDSFPLEDKSNSNSYPIFDVIDQSRILIKNLKSHNFLAINGKQIDRYEATSTSVSDIEKIKMFNIEKGWAQSKTRNCTIKIDPIAISQSKKGFICEVETSLLSTENGGKSWDPIRLPETGLKQISQSIDFSNTIEFPDVSSLSNEVRIAAQGFDSCVPASINQMLDWWNNSPYYVWNLYTGGSNRGCNAANQAALTSSFISQLRQQGWYFIPTWVGLQASCSTGNFYKMSSNAATAFNQGVSEANSASDAVATLGFTGSIIYFDLEAFNMADSTCVAAARSFISGWTYQLHNRGNLAGLYAMAYEVVNYSTITYPPDGLWMAGGGTNYSSYNPNATVWGNRYAPDSLWPNTQRIYQYTTGHNETYGSTTMNIDSDVINGIVAVPGTVSNCPGPTLTSPVDLFVSTNQTITFNWAAPNGCTFDGYTFRIKDTPNMDEGGNTLIDISTTSGSKTTTISSQWNNRDLYWGVRTNFPYSPNWSVRRFRIESSTGCNLGVSQVALFTEPNYSGTCIIKNVGDYPNPTAMGITTDEISSVMVGASVQLTLCRDEDFLGICETLNKDDPNLSDNSIGDNLASSAKVASLPVSIILYSDANYLGSSCQLTGTGWMNACSSFDNLASSIQIAVGWSARVWSEKDLRGESRCLTSSFPNFSGFNYNENGTNSLNNSISSFSSFYQTNCYPLLNISINGNGSGSVVSSPYGINCGSTCSASFSDNSIVTLTATASTGSTFTGWSGEGCSGTGSCVVTMSAAKSVTATFTLIKYPLTIYKTGSGTITSYPEGLNCGPTCVFSFNYNTLVTLVTAPTTGSNFSSWGGACSGSGSCQVTMSSAKSVDAIFTYDINTLTVSRNGTGTGTVTSSPSGINCGSTCSAPFSYPTTVTLTATPESGSTFTGWSGYCSGTGSCQVPMTATRSVTATFSRNTFTLGISKTGTGHGTITSTPAGINCGSTCSFPFTENTLVTLAAIPASSKDRFSGWSGEGCSGTGTCVVTMSSARSVTASFEYAVFDDVPFGYSQTLGGVTYNLYPYIQALWDNGFTNGIWIEKNASGNITYALYGPTNNLNRGMVAKFLLNVVHGRDYTVPPLPANPKFNLDNWSNPDITWAWPWAEELLTEGLTNGCFIDPVTTARAFCPMNISSRAEAAKFGLTMKHGSTYLPPAASGTVFADMLLPSQETDPAAHWGIDWAEQAFAEGLLPACGSDIPTGKPLFCPDDPVNRAWSAYLIVKANNLPLP